MASISTGSVGCNILVYVVSKGRAEMAVTGYADWNFKGDYSYYFVVDS